MWRSLPQTETAFTSIRTSSSLTFGSGTSRISTRPFPFPYFTTAFIFHLLIVALPFNWDDILRVSKLNGHGSQNLPLPSPTCSPNKFFGRRERLRVGRSPLFAKEGYCSSLCEYLPAGRQGRMRVIIYFWMIGRISPPR